ncbi:hypothetical protein P280DRAFT_520678 [Massarina eburnea CBS 473.64]|uniref:Zn(2)-C6 fungal-type domain-containing protein n=1 Tax=Massarina eburnea CBS 473.64 TaxID=1395130 RepID=A0A6A6RVS1_9PLEO|nr:hypothetical protein P280DRAFT_520678 [Massarina eburnea CBS 473.64]
MQPISQSSTSPTCRQCRARKVRCDRNGPSCGACTRLHLDCSLHGSADHLVPSEISDRSASVPPDQLTEAGIKRRRTRHACKQCRLLKAKCSGDDPCERCQGRNQQCEKYSACLGHVSGTSFSPGTTGASYGVWALDRPAVRRYIEAYYDKTGGSSCVFLHRPSTLADWSRGSIEPILLTALCASGLRLCPAVPGYKSTSMSWIREAQSQVLGKMHNHSLTQLQSLVLIIQFHMATGQHSEAWNLISLAARLAFTLRLNYENEKLDAVARESRRRLVWAIYQLDYKFAGGNDDLALCPAERMHIRLPCDYQSFQRGVASRAGYLGNTDAGEEGSMDWLGYHIRLSALQYRILHYTKNVRRLKESPYKTKNVLETLHEELQAFSESLPADMKTESSRLLLIANMPSASAILVLHILWLQCHCDLYRFLIPGLHEAVSSSVIASTPPSYTIHCQKVCLENAIRLCNFWSEIYHLEHRPTIENLALVISIYQVTQILHHLSHQLLENGPESVDILKEKLNEAIQLTGGIEGPSMAAIRWREDAERSIRGLGKRLQSSDDDSDQENEHHFPSHHSLIPKDPEIHQQEDPGPGLAETTLASLSADVSFPYEDQDDFISWNPFDIIVNPA